MSDLVVLGMIFLVLGFSLFGYFSKFKLSLLVSIGFIITLMIEFGNQNLMMAATALGGLALFNLWMAFNVEEGD